MRISTELLFCELWIKANGAVIYYYGYHYYFVPAISAFQSLRKEFHHNGFLQGMLGIIIAVRIKA